jgi:hypothetical protein
MVVTGHPTFRVDRQVASYVSHGSLFDIQTNKFILSNNKISFWCIFPVYGMELDKLWWLTMVAEEDSLHSLKVYFAPQHLGSFAS